MIPNLYKKNRSVNKKYKKNIFLKKNEAITSSEVRVISPEGAQYGILKTKEAIKLAKSMGLELVEITAKSNPPVCKILDVGKYLYEKSKKKSLDPKILKIKEIKFHLNIETSDYETKIKKAEKLLLKGYKVKFTLIFRGREMERKNDGKKIMDKIIDDLLHINIKYLVPKFYGKLLVLLIFSVEKKSIN